MNGRKWIAGVALLVLAVLLASPWATVCCTPSEGAADPSISYVKYCDDVSNEVTIGIDNPPYDYMYVQFQSSTSYMPINQHATVKDGKMRFEYSPFGHQYPLTEGHYVVSVGTGVRELLCSYPTDIYTVYLESGTVEYDDERDFLISADSLRNYVLDSGCSWNTQPDGKGKIVHSLSESLFEKGHSVTLYACEQHSLVIKPDSATITVGETKSFTAKYDGSPVEATWSVSDSTVIKLLSGTNPATVEGLKDGTATLTATYNGYTAVAEVTVTSSPSPEPVPVTGVTLDIHEANIGTGETFTLHALISPNDATDKSVTWSSSDASVATVSTDGTVKGMKLGTATITVTTNDGSYTDTCTVTVSDTYIVPSTLEMSKGEEKTLTLMHKGSAVTSGVTWSVEDTSVAYIVSGKAASNPVTVHALSSGITTITATYNGSSYTATIEVIVHAESVELDKTEVTIGAGENVTLVATVLPADAVDKTVKWKSSDESIAVVTAEGKVFGISEGTATITVTTNDGGFTATCTVHVTASKLYIEPSSLDLEKGKNETLTAMVGGEPVDDAVWSISDESIASLSGTNSNPVTVTALKSGSAVVTVRSGGQTATCTVNVVVHVTGVTLDVTSAELGIYERIVLHATVEPDDATDKTVTWSSSNSDVAMVLDDGTVIGVSPGNATITVTTNDGGFTATCAVVVIMNVIPEETKDGKLTPDQETEILDKVEKFKEDYPDATPLVYVKSGKNFFGCTTGFLNDLADDKLGATLAVGLNNGLEVTMYSKSVKALGLKSGSTFELVTESVEPKESAVMAEYRIYAKVDGSPMDLNFGDSKIAIFIPYELKPGQKVENLKVKCIETGEYFEFVYTTGEEIGVTFETSKLSYNLQYAITYEEESPGPEPVEIPQLLIVAIIIIGILILLYILYKYGEL